MVHLQLRMLQSVYLIKIRNGCQVMPASPSEPSNKRRGEGSAPRPDRPGLPRTPWTRSAPRASRRSAPRRSRRFRRSAEPGGAWVDAGRSPGSTPDPLRTTSSPARSVLGQDACSSPLRRVTSSEPLSFTLVIIVTPAASSVLCA